ncbi:hypothetical protein [Leptospira licerasiae]|uniref:hypothetical protein n=1 Tax=Leptospira licerasiae TaxID=447106 RepID=UPI00301AF4C9
MKFHSKQSLILANIFMVVFLGITDCSSRILLVYNRLPKMDSSSEHGRLEISLENKERNKVKSIYIWYFALFDKEIIEVAANKVKNIQTHEGNLYTGLPYEIKLPTGEYYARLEALDVPAEDHDLTFPFSALFGYYLDLKKEQKIAIESNYSTSNCSIDKKFLHQCSKIIIKKDTITKIIIRVQKEVPIKTELGMGVMNTTQLPIPYPRAVYIQESPEVLIEVQNPK